MQEQKSKFMPALWGGVLIGVISGVPFLNFINCACCAGVIAGGILAVYIYRKDLSNDMLPTVSDGAVLGLIAGVIGAVIGSIFDLAFGSMTFDFFEKIAEYSDNPELLDFLDQFGDKDFGVMMMTVGFFMELVIDTIFGLVGGLIGVAIFAKKKGE